MFLLISRRLFYLLLTLPLVILISFLIFKTSPIDPVERLIDKGEFSIEKEAYNKIYTLTAKNNDLHLPSFYFSINSSNFSQDYYNLVLPGDKEFYQGHLKTGCNFQSTKALLSAIRNAREEIKADSNSNQALANKLRMLEFSTTYNDMSSEFRQLAINSSYVNDELFSSFKHYESDRSISSLFLPKLIWHGTNNQYHNLIKRYLKFDFGRSIHDGRKVISKIGSAFYFSFLMIVLAFLIIYPLGIALGKKMALHKDKLWADIVEGILFVFAAIPLFWLATMMVIFFTTPEYGSFMNIFPSVSSYRLSSDSSFLSKILENGSQFILPIFCILLTDLAILTRQTKTLITAEDNKAYLITAKMKGLKPEQIQSTHSFKMARPQLLTMASSGLAAAFSGQLVLEYIFNIPGMGRLMIDSIQQADWPVLMLIIVILFILTSLIYIISDLFYTKLDPRIKAESL